MTRIQGATSPFIHPLKFKHMKNFIILTDTREAVGVEEVVERKVLVSVDHIIKVDAVEPHIAEALGYNATVTLASSGQYSNFICTKETQDQIIHLLHDRGSEPASMYW